MKLLLALASLALPLPGQIHLGIKAGVPLTDLTETISTGFDVRINERSRWTVGPMAEVDLPFGFGVELDALYRRVGYKNPEGRAFIDGLWDIPLLAKYKLGGKLVRPYLAAGWTYRRLTEALRFSLSSSNGVVAAAVFRLNAAGLKISPVIRYTNWSKEGLQPGLRTKKDQAEILAGFTF